MSRVMNLRERLLKLDPLTRRPGSKTAPQPPASEPRPVSGPGDDHAAQCDALAMLPGEGPADGIWWRQDLFARVAPPPWPPADLRGILAGGDMIPSGWQDVLLLDTETTGLSGGTGTLVFLVGLGWWRDGTLTVHQIFLPGLQHEGALLAALTEIAIRFRWVVTYNGAGFDLPLLRTRTRLNRRDDPCSHLVSWDLLTAARRLWGRGLPDSRQQTIEQRVCGYARGPGDIPGREIPGVYLHYLRQGATADLSRVLRHNRRDIVGLGSVLGAVVGRAGMIATGPTGRCGAAHEAWSNALVCERRRQRETAAEWAAELVASAALAHMPRACLLDTIRQLKRVAAWPQVATVIEHGLARWPRDLRLHYEAAVLYEHRLGDPCRALRHATQLQDDRRRARLGARLAGDR